VACNTPPGSRSAARGAGATAAGWRPLEIPAAAHRRPRRSRPRSSDEVATAPTRVTRYATVAYRTTYNAARAHVQLFRCRPGQAGLASAERSRRTYSAAPAHAAHWKSFQSNWHSPERLRSDTTLPQTHARARALAICDRNVAISSFDAPSGKRSVRICCSPLGTAAAIEMKDDCSLERLVKAPGGAGCRCRRSGLGLQRGSV
jgi:hypothetical protein